MSNEIILKGTARNIGFQQGEVLRGEIKTTFEIYSGVWSLSQNKINERVRRYRAAVRRHFPHLDEEIESIALSAGLPWEAVYAINARTELLSQNCAIECTSVGISAKVEETGCVLVGQNWDWVNELRGLTRIVEVCCDEKPRIKMMIEPGMIGKIGMNEYGVGLCLNFLETYGSKQSGIPIHVLARAVLECSSADKARELIEQVPRAASVNYLVGDKSDTIYCLETTPERVHQVRDNQDLFTHTNSYVCLGESCGRKAIFENVLKAEQIKKGKVSVDGLKNAFCAKGVEFPKSNATYGVESIHTIIMNLTKGELLVSDGCRSNEYDLHSFM